MRKVAPRNQGRVLIGRPYSHLRPVSNEHPTSRWRIMTTRRGKPFRQLQMETSSATFVATTAMLSSDVSSPLLEASMGLTSRSAE